MMISGGYLTSTMEADGVTHLGYLPNIIGEAYGKKEAIFDHTSGAFYTNSKGERGQARVDGSGDRSLHLDASRCSITYGRGVSDTEYYDNVIPASVKMYLCIKY